MSQVNTVKPHPQFSGIHGPVFRRFQGWWAGQLIEPRAVYRFLHRETFANANLGGLVAFVAGLAAAHGFRLGLAPSIAVSSCVSVLACLVGGERALLGLWLLTTGFLIRFPFSSPAARCLTRGITGYRGIFIAILLCMERFVSISGVWGSMAIPGISRADVSLSGYLPIHLEGQGLLLGCVRDR